MGESVVMVEVEVVTGCVLMVGFVITVVVKTMVMVTGEVIVTMMKGGLVEGWLMVIVMVLSELALVLVMVLQHLALVLLT